MLQKDILFFCSFLFIYFVSEILYFYCEHIHFCVELIFLLEEGIKNNEVWFNKRGFAGLKRIDWYE